MRTLMTHEPSRGTARHRLRGGRSRAKALTIEEVSATRGCDPGPIGFLWGPLFSPAHLATFPSRSGVACAQERA
jgi:hypothetical protein